MVLRSESVGEQDVADQQGAFAPAAPSRAREGAAPVSGPAAGRGALGVMFFGEWCLQLLPAGLSQPFVRFLSLVLSCRFVGLGVAPSRHSALYLSIG